MVIFGTQIPKEGGLPPEDACIFALNWTLDNRHWTQSGRLRDTETASSKSTAYPDTGRRAHSYIHVLITKTIQTHRNLFYNKESWSTIMTRRKLVLQERNDQDVKILLTQRHN